MSAPKLDFAAMHLRSESYVETIFALGQDSSVELEATAALYASLGCLWQTYRVRGGAPATLRRAVNQGLDLILEESDFGPSSHSRGGAVSAMLAERETFHAYRGLRVRLQRPEPAFLTPSLHQIDRVLWYWLIPSAMLLFLGSWLWLR